MIVFDPAELNVKVGRIRFLCEKSNRLARRGYGSKEHKEIDAEFLSVVLDLDHQTGPGINPGRLIKLPVQRGYAWYIVLRVGKLRSKVAHIPYGEALESPLVVNGEIEDRFLKEFIGFEDSRRAAVSRTGRGG